MTQPRAEIKHAALTGLLSLAAAAEYIGTSEKTLRNYIASGHLQAFRIGGKRHIRIRPADLDALLVPVAVGRGIGEFPQRSA